VAAGLKKRFEQNAAPLNIIICENMIGADKYFHKLLLEQMPGMEDILSAQVGLVEPSIGRMVPVQTDEMKAGNPLRVCVEEYGYIPVDKAAFKGAPPDIKRLVPCDNFDYYIKRKLFVHNMGHAVAAYLGLFLNINYSWQAIGDARIRVFAENAMLESAMALAKAYNMPLDKLVLHIKDLLYRFSNKALGDTCARVGNDTARKLGPDDRLIGAMKFCSAQGVKPAFIAVGAGAGLHRHLEENNIEQTHSNAQSKLRELSGLEAGSELSTLVLDAWEMMQGSWFNYQKLLSHAEQESKQSVM
jgi:mannitol-1-phosphate 5-dehydrogenase